MKFRIDHQTTYTFSEKAFLEPHTLRFRPKITPHQRLETFDLKVKPAPDGISFHRDVENNMVDFCWFSGLHRELMIQSSATIDSQPYNPYNFLIHPSEFQAMPFIYPPRLKPLIQPYLEETKMTFPLVEYAEQVKAEAKYDTVNFLSNLTGRIHDDFRVEEREFGTPLDPDDTFQLKKGSCRDLVWMQMHLLRNSGIAARFVSGYYFLDEAEDEFELHAWLEVFLPGAGWIGFDPSHGVAAENTHIPVVASARFENAMPVTGTIRGDATSELSWDLSIEKIG